MEDLDIQNAIATLNTIYFFKCARKQGYTKIRLVNRLMHLFHYSRKKAVRVIYDAASLYCQAEQEKDCIRFLIRFVNKDAVNPPKTQIQS